MKKKKKKKKKKKARMNCETECGAFMNYEPARSFGGVFFLLLSLFSIVIFILLLLL